MGLFKKNKSDFNFSVSSYQLKATHLKVLIAKTLVYALGQEGYIITTVNKR